DALVIALDGTRLRLPVLRSGEDVVVFREGRQRFRPASPYAFEGASGEADDAVRSPMPGRVVAVHVAEGDSVSSGQPLLVMEAMKMELTLRAPADGQVAVLAAVAGEFVEADVVLVRLGSAP